MISDKDKKTVIETTCFLVRTCCYVFLTIVLLPLSFGMILGIVAIIQHLLA